MRTCSHSLWRTPAKTAAVWRLSRLLAAAVLLAPAASAAALQVTVSLPPYANIVERIGGEHLTVSTLLPPGASPHAFDPTPSQAASLARADLIVMNGGIDAWLDRLVAATAPDAPILVITQSIDLDTLAPRGADADHETEQAHGHVGANPHVWLDPLLMIEAAGAIADALKAIDPANSAAYAAGLEQLTTDLLALDAELTSTLAPVAGAPFVPFHDAWPYFARRYDLDLVLTLEPFPGREPSPSYVAEAVATVRAVGAKAIFDERQLNPRSAQVVAESAGVALATLDPLGGAPGPTSYEELLRQNAATILGALR